MEQKYLDKMMADGRIRGYKDMAGGKTALSPTQRNKVQQKDPGHKIALKSLLRTFCFAYDMVLLEEQRFHLWRKWRIDWVITGQGRAVGIEYEGLGFKKTGHTTSEGYTGNCAKYNAAAVQGIHILRYTHLNYEEAVVDLKDFFITKYGVKSTDGRGSAVVRSGGEYRRSEPNFPGIEEECGHCNGIC